MKKLLKASAWALAMSLVLFGCANNTKDSITAPKVDAIDTSTIKPAEVNPNAKPISNETELKEVANSVVNSVVTAFKVEGPLVTDLKALVMGPDCDFYKEVVKPFEGKEAEDTYEIPLDLANKTYKSPSEYATIKFTTGKLDYKYSREDSGKTDVNINGNVDANALLDIDKAEPTCMVKKAAANVKAIAKDVKFHLPESTSEEKGTASGAAAASVAASAFFDNGTYAGFANVTASLAIPDANALVAKIEEIMPNLETIFTRNPEPTMDDIADICALYDKLPISLNVKVTITDVNNKNEFVVADVNSCSKLFEASKDYIPAN